MVYFMQSVGGGPLKIGFSDDVGQRRKQLEAKYKCPLAALAVIPGDKEKEREIHARFAHLRLGRKEQFQPAPDLLEFIGRPLLVGANPDTVEVMKSFDQPPAFQIRGSSDWKAWVKRVAEFDDRPTVLIIERALREYAERIGFTESPPRR